MEKSLRKVNEEKNQQPETCAEGNWQKKLDTACEQHFSALGG